MVAEQQNDVDDERVIAELGYVDDECIIAEFGYVDDECGQQD
ncbi:hypothetical protein [Paenibacillus dendritiformis]|nr:hypothetical protein [Paenibacillus dendritiformis]